MKNILLVDDSEETRDLVKMIFIGTEEELHIDYASTSKKAIELFNQNVYNACILDVSLPDLTGYYLGQLIRKACPEMPIAFLTNYDGDLTKENADFINAKFWVKSTVFGTPMQLKNMVTSLAGDNGCGGKNTIVMPELLKELT